MKKFHLYSYILNEGHALSKEELQRIGAELVYALHGNLEHERYSEIMDEAIENINDSLGLGLPYENETVERYNGYTNRDTWLIALWLMNDERNYRLAIEEYNKGMGVEWNNPNKYHYGDEINFTRVNVSEIEAMMDELIGGL